MPQDKSSQSPQPQRQAPADQRFNRPQAPSTAVVLSIVAVILGGLALMAGLIWWLVVKTFGVGPKVLVVIGAVAIVYALVVNFRGLVASFKERRTVSGLNTILFATMVFGILVLLNYMAVRHHARYDASKSKQYSLSDQSIRVIKSLSQDVHMLAFFTPEYPDQQKVRDRLEEYAAQSPHVKLEFYDPTTRVDKARENNVSVDGVVVVKIGDKKEEVMGGDEERLTSAVLSVTTGQKTKVFFLIGHGEYDPTDTGQDAVATLKQGLESQQYAVETLALANQPNPVVPTDCAALIIAGAQNPLQPKETAAIAKYADQGGKLFIALAATPKAPDFSQILQSRGVTVMRGTVMDPNAQHNAGAPAIVAVLKPEQHQITNRLQGIVLPVSTALKVDSGAEPPPSYPGAPPPPSTKKADELLKTSGDAWLDHFGANGKGNSAKDPGEETGPLTLAAAIDQSKKQDQPEQQPGMPPQEDKPGPGTRIVVVANAEFMADRLVQGAQLWANAGLVMSSVAWLVGNEKLISIPPKEEQTPYLTMVGAQKAITSVIALIIIPGLVVLAGGLVWWRRRR
jgi:ABC-type uncharacterized transport system involved in gliding motility auxiliary subunit